MKKILPIVTLLLMCVLSLNAQQRKTWNFRNGVSNETLENLEADPNWSYVTNADGSFKESKDQKKMQGTLMANGVVIKELAGITFGLPSKKADKENFIIGSNKFRFSRTDETFTLRVVPGQTITMKARSANGEAKDRGFKSTDESVLKYVSGPENGICIGYKLEAEGRDENGDYTLVWEVQKDAPVGENDSLDVTIKCTPAGGLDVSLIQIDEGDEPAKTGIDIAYIFDSSFEGYNRKYLNVLNGPLKKQLPDAAITTIDLATDDLSGLDRDSLMYYNVVVLSGAIKSDHAIVPVLKDVVAYTPVLSFGTNLYEAWGYGKAVEVKEGAVKVGKKFMENDLFADNEQGAGIQEDSTIVITGDGRLFGYTAEEGSYFAADQVMATAGDVNMIHMHNAKRNAYIMLPYDHAMSDIDNNMARLIPNAVVMLNKTKTEITESAKPVITQTYRDQMTIVSMTCATANHKIYYTTDGTEPTTASTVYTEPFDITTAGTVVKAISTADGYWQSQVREQTIAIYGVSAAPKVELTKESGKTIVTITPDKAEDIVFYNFRGQTDTLACSRYTEPIELKKHATITVFAGQFAADNTFLPTEAVEQYIDVQDEKVRIDIVSHMDANKAEYNIKGSAGGSNENYTSGFAYWSDDIESTTTDPESGEEVNTYVPSGSVVFHTPATGWEVRTEGQAMLWQNIGPGHEVGNGSNYNPETALDDNGYVSITSNCISFGSNSAANIYGEANPAFTGSIQSTQTFKGPFDIVANVADTNRNGGSSDIKLYVTTDTLSGNWTEVGTFMTSETGRLWKRFLTSYEGEDEVFVKLCSGVSTGVFDIYILNAGEKSAELTGIKDVTTGNETAAEVVRTMVYSLNGAQLSKATRGINIIKEVYADGTVKTRKVMVK